ncbi:DUF1330 domain-containing protein [Streptomyces bobili]
MALNRDRRQHHRQRCLRPAAGAPRPPGAVNTSFLIPERLFAMSENSKKKFYALNMFDVTDVEKYVAYFSRLPEVAPQYGGRMVAFGRFRDNVAGDLAPRQVLFLVEWESEEAFNTFRDDPELVDFHPLRENGTASYIWQTFDGLDMSDPADVSIDDVLAVLKP